jgi:hypothetical protein
MNLTRQNQNGFPAGRCLVAMVAVLMAGGLFAAAQSTNAPARTDYSSFRVIVERNIFNPNRYPRTSRSSQRSTPQSVPAFLLVGTLDYQKGTFAFFDGTTSDYRKVLQRDGNIAGYTVTEITLDGVKLAAGGKQIEMKIGAQMRQESAGAWELSGQSELPASAAADTTSPSDETSAASASSSSSSGEENDVLKKLMQQREQELK